VRLEHVADGRHLAARRELRRIPEVGAHEGTRAMNERLIDSDDKHGFGRLARYGKLIDQLRISGEVRSAVHPERFVDARY